MTVATQASLSEPFATVLSLYEKGQCLAAWEAGQAQGPLASWPGTEARVLAGRLAPRLGSPRLGSLLQLRAYRADPTHAEAQYFYVVRVWEHRGPLAAWQERRRLGEPASDVALHHADYHGQCGQLLGVLRDFDAAAASLKLADATLPDRLFSPVEWSQLYRLQDRHQDALAVARTGLAAAHAYSPVVLSVAESLVLLNRDEEALDLVRARVAESQNSDLSAFLVRLLMRMQRLDEALEELQRFDAHTPLKEEGTRTWLAQVRTDIAIRRGDLQTALGYLEQTSHPYYLIIGENLRAFLRERGSERPRRLEHPVGYVHQHYRTCAPATLSAISAFWKRPAEHLAVAEEICYDGTPSHSERRWAEENGWLAREFRVDWPSARALLDRGIPFTLTVSDVTVGHLQAVIGYDEAAQTLLIRDPLLPDTLEVNAVELLRQQRSSGPRGMVMVPADRARLLDGLELPEADRYDRLYALERALEAHDRERAARCHQDLVAMDPEHRLTHYARWALARYDANPHESLAAVNALLALFPGDPRLQLARLHNLRPLAQRDEVLRWLGEICQRRGADPTLRIEYVAQLSADDRLIPDAAWHLRRALRSRPADPNGIWRLADLSWRTGRRSEAAQLYRFAACLEDLNEGYAHEYFLTCRWEKQTEAGLAFLRERVERLGARSGDPAMTLFQALESLDRTDEAFAVLDRAVERRPADGELRLFAAARCFQHGRLEEARAHREAARERVKHAAWLAETAREARLRGDREQALAHWREIAAAQPLDLQAHDMIALLLSETSTRFEAIEHLQSACERFPHHAGLHRLLYDWTEGDPAVERERVLRRLLEINPADGWAWRELAVNLSQQARGEQALAAAREALAVDAANTFSHSVTGYVLEGLARRAEAVACYREALRYSADNTNAIRGLLDHAGESASTRREVLEFVEDRLLEQTVEGDGLLAFREAARGMLAPAELLESLRRAHQQRPDLWHAWSALAMHLSDMGRAESLDVAWRATERFPRLPRLWLDLSRVHRARLELDRQVEALERCRELSPEWTTATRELCDAWELAGRREESIRLLETAIRRTPLEPQLRTRLASLQHARGDVDQALETLREALRLNPELSSAWQMLSDWSSARGRGAEALDLARAFAQSRSGEPRPWLQLAELHLGAGRAEEALEALERALAINPRLIDAYDQKARALALLRRFPDAEAACRPEPLGEPPPVSLQGRAAWVNAQRGDLTGAVRRMRAVLDAHPDYVWGWQRMAEWRSEQGELGAALKAAERVAWLDPGNVVPLGWVGDLKERMRDMAGAKAAFERAMRLDPSYTFAGFRYLAHQRKEKDLQGARRTLEILKLHARRDSILLAQLELAAAEGNRDQCLEIVRDLCRDQTADGQVLTRAAEIVTERQWGFELERLLRRLLAQPGEWHRQTPALWAKVRVWRGALGGIGDYPWLARMGEPGRDAILEFLSEIGDRANRTGPSGPAFRSLLDWHLFRIRSACRAWQASDDSYWGQMSYALLSCNRPRAVIRWMRDWQTRKDAPAFALQNLASALLYRHRDQQAMALLRHVSAELAPRKQVGSLLALWSCLVACLDGDLATARRLLHETPRDATQARDQVLREFAETIVDILGEPPGARAFTSARKDVMERARLHERYPARARLVRLAAYHVARRARRPLLMLHGWVDLHTGVVIAAAVVAFFVVLVLFD